MPSIEDSTVGKYDEFKRAQDLNNEAQMMINGGNQNSSDINSLSKQLLIPPYNETDPFVIFDPILEKPGATENLISEKQDERNPAEKTKWDGIKYPIIKLNSTNISPKNIKEFKLKFRKFLPELELVIKDPKDIDFIGIPSFLNQIVVIMVPQFQGLYRNIALPFYIDERIDQDDDTVKFTCKVHYKGLRDIMCDEIDSKPLSTFNMCYKIAQNCGLGFAVTQQCEEISDERWRQVYSQKISDYIEEQISIGGLDENSIFDAWIDGHGYLILENLAWVFSYNILPENLMILEKTGSDLPIKDDMSGEPFESNRLVSNIPGYNIPNLFFTSLTPYMSTEEATEIGTLGSFWCLTNIGTENTLVQYDVQMIDESPDAKAHPEFYEMPKTEYIGADMSEDTPYLIQERIRKSWITKKRSKRLILCLKDPNFGIERGMLINVLTVEDNPNKMGALVQNVKNFTENNGTNGAPYNVDDSVNQPSAKTLIDESTIASNMGYSGMYYVDGVEFWYNIENQKFEQFLILISKNSMGSLFNLMSGETLTTEQVKIINAPQQSN